jgi:RNA polymerase sigma factor (sigma-70 family)
MVKEGQPQSLSAVELISRCGNDDDPAVWSEFVACFHRRILLYVLRELHLFGLNTVAPDTVSDLTQEVYLRLLSNDRKVLREFKGDTEYAVLAYLACIVHSVISDQIRRERRLKRSVSLTRLDMVENENKAQLNLAEILPPEETFSPDRMLSERLAPARLRALLTSTLTGANASRDAIIFQLHIVNGLSAREIAELPALGMTVVNVEAVIRRTRERLRAALNINPSGLSV